MLGFLRSGSGRFSCSHRSRCYVWYCSITHLMAAGCCGCAGACFFSDFQPQLLISIFLAIVISHTLQKSPVYLRLYCILFTPTNSSPSTKLLESPPSKVIVRLNRATRKLSQLFSAVPSSGRELRATRNSSSVT